ncbi:hypothetical protein PIROE2DRAFT_61725 [Piromyces sp. E2]|nr:hypothetical protein PIROE2DRAFT_61725 [Piromyces sp. E2]|eukprot:OUM62693.1 hypothetical protein PIROE2DRAFT_61725 [Piromyces sp. E2]
MKSFTFIIVTIASLSSVLEFTNANTDVYLNTYGECNSVPSSEEESKTFCSTIITSEKCQNYYNNPDKVIGDGFDELDIATVHYHREKAKVVCQTDDTKTRCPIGQYFIDISTDSSVSEDDYILKSCRSKVCIDATSSYIVAKEKYYSLKYPDKMENFSKKFKSQNELLKCTDPDAIAKANAKNSVVNSDTNKVTTESNSTNGSNSKNGSNNNPSNKNNADASTNSTSNENITNENANVNSNANEGTSTNNKNIDLEQSNFGESISFDKKIALLIGFILANVWAETDTSESSSTSTTTTSNENVFFFAPEKYKDLLENIVQKYAEFTKSKTNLKGSRKQIQKSSIEMVYSNKDEIEYGNEVRELIKNKSDKYDFILYNTLHTYTIVGRKLINLKKLISLNNVEELDKGITKYIGYKDDSLVGIPLLANYGYMYYNKYLLDKYNRPIPQTWDELYETLELIYNKERIINRYLIGYLGNLPESYVAINTIQEMIYSYRDEKNNKEIPDYRSHNSVEAMVMLKKLLDNFSTKELFQLEPEEQIKTILTGNVIFARIFNFPIEEEYKDKLNFMPIPGKHSGISGSAIYGYNIGISKYTNYEEKQQKLSVVLDYLISEEMQKYLAISKNMYSPLKKIYDNTTNSDTKSNEYGSNTSICESVDCEMLRDLQFFEKPINYYDSYDDFATEFLKIIDNYLYKNNATAEDTLKHIDNLTLNHYVKNNSKIGIFTYVLFGFIVFIMLTSYILMFNRKINVLFVFLNNTYWAVFLYGTFLIICYSIVSLGEMTQEKCNLRFVVLSLGVPIAISPLLLRLIVLYPESNKYSDHVNRNFSNYLCGHILFELLLCTLYLLRPFDVTNHLFYLEDNTLENFQSCDCGHLPTKLLLIVDIAEKGLEILIFAILIFAEWNIKATKTDIISLTFCIIFDILAFLIFAVLYFISFKTKEAYFWARVGPVLLFGLSNFFLVYIWKFAVMFTSAADELETKEAYLTKKTQNDNLRNITRLSLINSDGRMTSTKSSASNNSENFINKIIKCHYETANSQQEMNRSNASNVNNKNVISTTPMN